MDLLEKPWCLAVLSIKGLQSEVGSSYSLGYEEVSRRLKLLTSDARFQWHIAGNLSATGSIWHI